MSFKKQLLIKAKHFYLDAFSNPDIAFYLPTDELGNTTCVTKALRLERWVSRPDQRLKHLPTPLAAASTGISNALLKLDGQDFYVPLVRSVPLSCIAKMNEWLHTLHRDPSGDTVAFEAFISQDTPEKA